MAMRAKPAASSYCQAWTQNCSQLHLVRGTNICCCYWGLPGQASTQGFCKSEFRWKLPLSNPFGYFPLLSITGSAKPESELLKTSLNSEVLGICHFARLTPHSLELLVLRFAVCACRRAQAHTEQVGGQPAAVASPSTMWILGTELSWQTGRHWPSPIRSSSHRPSGSPLSSPQDHTPSPV